MRVLMISLDRGFLGVPGAGDVLTRHVKYGERVGKLDIIVFSPRGFLPASPSAKVDIWPTNSRFRLSRPVDAWRIGRAICERHRPNLVVAQDPLFTGLVGLRVKRRFGIPLIVDLHGDFWGNAVYWRESLVYFFCRPIMSYVVRRADGLRPISAGIAGALRRSGIPAERITVIPTPVVLDRFAEPEQTAVEKVRARWAGRPIVLFVGRLVKIKNVPMLLDAFAAVRSTHRAALVMVGDGPERAALERRAARLGIAADVSFLGSISQEELPALYGAAAVTVLVSYAESLGKVLIEAGMARCPVIATATIGAQDIVSDGKSGWLVPVGDTSALTERLAWALEHPDEAHRLGENAAAILRKRFDPDFVISRMIAFWQRVVFQAK
ncbi:glycosyltransferase [Candidatus Parcubacteria bacterium]|nr:glycosyltransferase [Candidatus Parcubacteria bacterium]